MLKYSYHGKSQSNSPNHHNELKCTINEKVYPRNVCMENQDSHQSNTNHLYYTSHFSSIQM